MNQLQNTYSNVWTNKQVIQFSELSTAQNFFDVFLFGVPAGHMIQAVKITTLANFISSNSTYNLYVYVANQEVLLNGTAAVNAIPYPFPGKQAATTTCIAITTGVPITGYFWGTTGVGDTDMVRCINVTQNITGPWCFDNQTTSAGTSAVMLTGVQVNAGDILEFELSNASYPTFVFSSIPAVSNDGINHFYFAPFTGDIPISTPSNPIPYNDAGHVPSTQTFTAATTGQAIYAFYTTSIGTAPDDPTAANQIRVKNVTQNITGAWVNYSTLYNFVDQEQLLLAGSYVNTGDVLEIQLQNSAYPSYTFSNVPADSTNTVTTAVPYPYNGQPASPTVCTAAATGQPIQGYLYYISAGQNWDQIRCINVTQSITGPWCFPSDAVYNTPVTMLTGGEVNIGDVLKFEVQNTNTSDIWSSVPSDNSDGVSHFYFAPIAEHNAYSTYMFAGCCDAVFNIDDPTAFGYNDRVIGIININISVGTALDDTNHFYGVQLPYDNYTYIGAIDQPKSISTLAYNDINFVLTNTTLNITTNVSLTDAVFIGPEDLPVDVSDLNYNDCDFVVTNVDITTNVTNLISNINNCYGTNMLTIPVGSGDSYEYGSFRWFSLSAPGGATFIRNNLPGNPTPGAYCYPQRLDAHDVMARFVLMNPSNASTVTVPKVDTSVLLNTLIAGAAEIAVQFAPIG